MWDNDITSSQKKYYRKYGRDHRERTPKEVHERIQHLFIKNAEIAKRNIKWFDSTPNEFMAVYTPKSREVQDLNYILYFCDHVDGAHSTRYIRPSVHDDVWAMCLRDEELPLHTNIKDESIQDIIKGRLKGDTKEIPMIQHLHNEKEIIDRKWSRIRRMLGRYLNFFKKIADADLCKSTRKYDCTKIVSITVEGTEYIFQREAHRLVYLYPEDIRRINL